MTDERRDDDHDSAQALVGQRRRRGTVVPLLALTIVALVGFLALAIDLGMLAIAKTQAQNAADLAALTAARTLNGNCDQQLQPDRGHDQRAEHLDLQHDPGPGDSIVATDAHLRLATTTTRPRRRSTPITRRPAACRRTAVAATVTANSLPGAFSTIFGTQFLPSVTATAQAVHRPRDIALVMDLSGSMRMGTCLGFDFYTAVAHHQQSRHRSSRRSATIRRPAPACIGPSTNRTSSDRQLHDLSEQHHRRELLVFLDVHQQLLSKRRLCLHLGPRV